MAPVAAGDYLYQVASSKDAPCAVPGVGAPPNDAGDAGPDAEADGGAQQRDQQCAAPALIGTDKTKLLQVPFRLPESGVVEVPIVVE